MAYRTVVFLFPVFCCMVMMLTAGRSAELYQSDLLRELLNNYDHNGLPRLLNDTEPIDVTLSFALTAIYGLNEKLQILNGLCNIEMEWYDRRLVWNNMEEYSNVHDLSIDASRIWAPEMAIKNSAESLFGDLLDVAKYQAKVKPDGRVTLWTGGAFKTACLLDLTYFPFDSQVCSIIIESWSLSVKLANNTNALLMDEYHVNGQYDIYESGSELRELVYGNETYQRIHFKLSMRRKPRFMVMTIVLPSVLYTLMMVLVFYLPADSGEKISLSITMLLSFSVFQVVLADYMPNTSDFTPLISIYLTCSMILSGLSLLMTVVVLNIRNKDPQHQPSPVSYKLLSNASKYLGLVDMHNKYKTIKLIPDFKQQPPCFNYRPEMQQAVAPKSDVVSDQGIVHKEIWIDLAKVMDRLMLYLFMIITILLSVGLLWVSPSLAKK